MAARRRPPGKPRTIAQEMRVIGLTKNHCQREIAEIVGLHKSVVYKIQRKYHLVLSHGRAYHSWKFRRPWEPRQWGPIMEELYANQRLPIMEIGKRVGLGYRATRTRLIELGFEIRPSWETRRGKSHCRRGVPRCACGHQIYKQGETRCSDCRGKRKSEVKTDLPLAA